MATAIAPLKRIQFGSVLDDYDGLRGWTLLALYDLEFHPLTLGEALEAFHLDRAVMYEDVTATLDLDEAEAFGVVEPLHCP
jgi:hypothetical protein